MSDYPMLISNKLHSFRNFQKRSYKCIFENIDTRLSALVHITTNTARYPFLRTSDFRSVHQQGARHPVPAGNKQSGGNQQKKQVREITSLPL